MHFECKEKAEQNHECAVEDASAVLSNVTFFFDESEDNSLFFLSFVALSPSLRRKKTKRNNKHVSFYSFRFTSDTLLSLLLHLFSRQKQEHDEEEAVQGTNRRV